MIGPAADRDEHDVGGERLGRALALRRRDADRRGRPCRAVDARHLGAEAERKALLLENALALLGDLAVHAGQDAVEELDDRHLGAEPPPDRADLQPDDAGADDEQPLRHALQLQRAGRGDDPLLVDLDAGERRRIGAGGDDDRLRLERLLAAVLRRDLDLARRGDAAGAVEGSILFFLNRKATPSTFDFTVASLWRHHRRQIELRRADLHAELGEAVARLLEHLGGVEQRLRRDAADVEAGAAEGGALLDDGDLQPELRGADGADIAARAGADDDEIVLDHSRQSVAGLLSVFHC